MKPLWGVLHLLQEQGDKRKKALQAAPFHSKFNFSGISFRRN